MCQWRFEMPILANVKRSTIRKAARCKPGDELSLRRWQDKAYRSKQCLIKTVPCRSVTPITIGISSQNKLWVIRHIDGKPELMNPMNLQHLARVEGFDSIDDMQKWFVLNHKLKSGIGIEAEQIQW
jgi:hypothetical protein